MNRYLIPSILIVTVLMAGIFAFQPIYEASTVHTTIATDIDDQNRVMTWTIEDVVAVNNIIPAGNTIAGHVTLSTIDGAGTCEIRAAGGADDTGVIDNLPLGTTTSVDLPASDGLDLVVEVGTSTCTLSIFIETAAD